MAEHTPAGRNKPVRNGGRLNGESAEAPSIDHSSLLNTYRWYAPLYDLVFGAVLDVITVTPDPARLLREAERVCTRHGQILILSHFSGGRWGWGERLLAPLAARIGFRSTMTMEETLHGCRWRVAETRSVNLFGLSKLIRMVSSGPDR